LKKLRTSSIISGSEAEASQRLFSMKMFGFDRRSLTLWKKFFSYNHQMADTNLMKTLKFIVSTSTENYN